MSHMAEIPKRKFKSWDIYALIFFIIIISTALILRFIQNNNEENFIEKRATPQNKNFSGEAKKEDKNVNPYKSGKIILLQKSRVFAQGYVFMAQREAGFEIFGYFNLPNIENGYAYSAWLYKNDLQEYKRLANLSEISQNIYFFQYPLEQNLFDFHDIVIALSQEGKDAASGTIVLRGSLKE